MFFFSLRSTHRCLPVPRCLCPSPSSWPPPSRRLLFRLSLWPPNTLQRLILFESFSTFPPPLLPTPSLPLLPCPILSSPTLQPLLELTPLPHPSSVTHSPSTHRDPLSLLPVTPSPHPVFRTSTGVAPQSPSLSFPLSCPFFRAPLFFRPWMRQRMLLPPPPPPAQEHPSPFPRFENPRPPLQISTLLARSLARSLERFCLRSLIRDTPPIPLLPSDRRPRCLSLLLGLPVCRG